VGTICFIPLSEIENASKDKDLLQRLESTVIYWTRQIKEVTSKESLNLQIRKLP